jgi:hypothetical protein
MGRERSSLEVEADFNQIELRVQQRPLVAWAVVAHLSTFVLFGGSSVFGLTGFAPFAILWFLAAMAFFAFGLMWKRPVTLSLGPTQLVVEAWTGLFARPGVHRLPLVGLQVEHATSGSVNKRRMHKLLLTPAGGETLRIGALACSADDLERLKDEVAAAQADAQARIGEGTDEIPAVLHAVRADAQPERG